MANEEVQSKGWAGIRGSFQSVDDVRPILPPGLYSLDLDEGKKLFTPVKSPSDQPTDLPGLPSKYLLDQIKLFWGRGDRYQKYHLLQKRGILIVRSSWLRQDVYHKFTQPRLDQWAA